MTTPDDYFAGEEYRRALLTKLTRQIFRRAKPGFHVNPAAEHPQPRNVVAEGDNPAPGYRFSERDHMRHLTREMFDPSLARTDPVTFPVVGADTDPDRNPFS